MASRGAQKETQEETTQKLKMLSFHSKSRAIANRVEDGNLLSTEDTNTRNQMERVQRTVTKRGKVMTAGLDDLKKILEESAGTAPSDEEVEFIIALADQDKNGHISKRELAVAVQAWQAYYESKEGLDKMVEDFKKKSGSEKFGKDEMRRLLESMNEGYPVTEPEVDYLIEQAGRFKDNAKALTAWKFRPFFPGMLTSGEKEKVKFKLKQTITGFILNQTILKRFNHDKVKLSVVGEWSLGDKILKIDGNDMKDFKAIGNEMCNFPKPVEVERPLVCGKPHVRASVYTVGEAESTFGILRKANKFLYSVGTGVYHVGIVVYGNEFSYGYLDNPVKPTATGVDCVFPGRHPMHQFQEFVDLGETKASRSEVADIVLELSKSWLGNEYHFLTHNCVNFSQALAKALGVEPVPKWCGSAAKAAESAAPILDTAQEFAANPQDFFLDLFDKDEEVDDDRLLGKEGRTEKLEEVFDQLTPKDKDGRLSLSKYRQCNKKQPDYAFTAFFDKVRAAPTTDSTSNGDDYITKKDFVDFHLDAWKEMTDDNFKWYAVKWTTLLPPPHCMCIPLTCFVQ